MQNYSLCITPFSIYLSLFIICRILSFVILRVRLSSSPSFTSSFYVFKRGSNGCPSITVFLSRFLFLLHICYSIYFPMYALSMFAFFYGYLIQFCASRISSRAARWSLRGCPAIRSNVNYKKLKGFLVNSRPE